MTDESKPPTSEGKPPAPPASEGEAAAPPKPAVPGSPEGAAAAPGKPPAPTESSAVPAPPAAAAQPPKSAAPGPEGPAATPPAAPASPAAAAPPAAAKPAPPPKVNLAAEVPSPVLDAIKERFPGAVQSVGYHAGEVTALLDKDSFLSICRFLKDDAALRMDYLSNLCGVDFPDRDKRFEVVYHLFSVTKKHRINLKIRVADQEPAPSVTGIWRTANWHEREAFDLLGIPFEGHPDLRRILLTDEWQGHPLRKEYPTRGHDRDHLKLR